MLSLWVVTCKVLFVMRLRYYTAVETRLSGICVDIVPKSDFACKLISAGLVQGERPDFPALVNRFVSTGSEIDSRQ